jgi:hypothetical protein
MCPSEMIAVQTRASESGCCRPARLVQLTLGGALLAVLFCRGHISAVEQTGPAPTTALTVSGATLIRGPAREGVRHTVRFVLTNTTEQAVTSWCVEVAMTSTQGLPYTHELCGSGIFEHERLVGQTAGRSVPGREQLTVAIPIFRGEHEYSLRAVTVKCVVFEDDTAEGAEDRIGRIFAMRRQELRGWRETVAALEAGRAVGSGRPGLIAAAKAIDSALVHLATERSAGDDSGRTAVTMLEDLRRRVQYALSPAHNVPPDDFLDQNLRGDRERLAACERHAERKR